MNTSKIEEAVIVPETKPETIINSDNDLLNKLSQVTERKVPGAKIVTESKKSFWDASDDDFDTVAPVKEEKSATETKEEPKVKLTEKAKQGSAKTAVGMLDFSSKLLFTPILNNKLKKKFEKTFTEKQTALLDEKIIDAEESELNAAEQRTKKRFESIMRKHDKKINAIPFSETEKTDLQDAFYNYFDFTETTLSPAWYLAMAVTNSMGSRAIDAFTD